jgi:pyruvate dehydrogenase E1 component beta subunit
MITYQDALHEATREEMARDARVFVYGIETKAFGSLRGLEAEFGPKRVVVTPVSEEGMTGFGIGAAINGLRPIHVHIRVDFLLLAFNQIANILSSLHYGSGGALTAPLVIRAIIGRGWGQGYQHSKSMQSVFAHIPGLKVVMPTTPSDAKGLLVSAIRDPNPVLVLEHRWLYWQEGPTPAGEHLTPIGPGQILRTGSDVTVIATSWMNVEALHAARILERRGVSVEIIDPRTLAPLDDTLLVGSVRKTRRCVVADIDWIPYGASAEITARVYEKAFDALEAPIERVGCAHTPCPTGRNLENAFYPNALSIVRAIERQLSLAPADLSEEQFFSYENHFKGPF